MLRLILLFTILIAGLIIGPIIAGHQGYVLIQTGEYNIETSITVLVMVSCLAIALILAIEWLLRRFLHAGSWTHHWFKEHKHQKANQQTKAALLKFIEGDYQQAQRLLTRNAPYADQPVVNYLLAAQSAQQLGEKIETNQYLQQASEASAEHSLPLEISRVRFQLAQGQLDDATQGVEQLLATAPRHPEVLRLAKQIYLSSHRADRLLELLPVMHKVNLYHEDKLESLEEQAYLLLMEKAVTEQGEQGLITWWQQQSRRIRRNITIRIAVIKQLLQHHNPVTAQNLLVEGLKQQYDERLIKLIPKLNAGNPEQLENALKPYLKQMQSNALLHRVLGQLLMSHGTWQEAYQALKTSLTQQEDPLTYAALADVLDHMQQHQEAANMRKMGLQLALRH